MCILLRDAPSLLLIQLLMLHYSLQMLHAFEKKTRFWKCRWQEKSSPRRKQIYFFNRFSGDILFFFSFFCFFWLLFFSCLMFFEIKNVYFDIHSTIRAVNFSPGRFPEIRLFFLALARHLERLFHFFEVIARYCFQ